MIEDYVRNCTLVRVIDGDTCILKLDLGCRLWIEQRVRILGVNCPEVVGENRAAGLAATEATKAWFENAGRIVVQTHLDKQDSFGRMLADIRPRNDSENPATGLSQWLLNNGHAVPYVR